MRLAFVTQVVDADDPVLAQTVDLVRALAARCERVTVLCDRVGRAELPANVSCRTFGAAGRAGRGLRFERELGHAMREGRPDALLAHMVPLFLLLSVPLAKALRIPLLLWYTHWNADRSLRVADRLCDLALSVDRSSYPLPSGKVRPIGHAIDVAAFAPRAEPPAADGGLRVLALGKLEPWKGFDVLLAGAEQAAESGLDVRVEIRGPQLTARQLRHRAELEERIRSSPHLRGRAVVEDAVPRQRIPDLIRGADLVVSPTAARNGAEALDKVVYEAAACAVPVLASNPSLEPWLAPHGLFVPGREPHLLARALTEFAALGPDRRGEIGAAVRRWVEECHSLDGWADQVVATVEELRRR